MARPLLLAVDEDQDVLEAVEAQLIQRYAHDYRVEGVSDPGQAIRVLEELDPVGADVALVLAGKSLWDAGGGDFLQLARNWRAWIPCRPHCRRRSFGGGPQTGSSSSHQRKSSAE